LASAAEPSLASSIFSKTELLEQVADNPDHGAVVIDHQDRHRQIKGHYRYSAQCTNSRTLA